MKKLLMIFVVALVSGCGVKGKPLPPLNPTLPSDGRLKSEKKKSEKTKSSLSYGESAEEE